MHDMETRSPEIQKFEKIPFKFLYIKCFRYLGLWTLNCYETSYDMVMEEASADMDG